MLETSSLTSTELDEASFFRLVREIAETVESVIGARRWLLKLRGFRLFLGDEWWSQGTWS
jgi:hypothetical protein